MVPIPAALEIPYFVDTHCHFDFPPFSGEEATSLVSAAQANVRQLIVPAVSAAYFPRILALAEHYPRYSPHSVCTHSILQIIRTLIWRRSPRCWRVNLKSW